MASPLPATMPPPGQSLGRQDEQQYYEQQGRAAAQQQAPAPAPAAATNPQRDVVQQLKDLGDLKTQGILTEEEFAAQKAKIPA